MNLLSISPRTLFLALFVVASGLLGFGLYLQHIGGLEPCPMCIMQRYAFTAVALLALIAGVHGPKRAGAVVYGFLTLVLALAGGGVALQQSILQRSPPSLAECGPGLEYMLESFGLAQALPMIFRGSGDCSSIDWTFLGLTIANWSLVCFAATAIFAVMMMVRGGKP